MVCDAASDACHYASICSTGTCGPETVKSDNTTCNDLNPDTMNDVCTQGVCAGEGKKKKNSEKKIIPCLPESGVVGREMLF